MGEVVFTLHLLRYYVSKYEVIIYTIILYFHVHTCTCIMSCVHLCIHVHCIHTYMSIHVSCVSAHVLYNPVLGTHVRISGVFYSHVHVLYAANIEFPVKVVVSQNTINPFLSGMVLG